MLFDVIPENFFGPLAAPGKIAYWECICRLFDITSKQLSFGVERDVLVDELQYYFESTMAADIPEEELEETGAKTSREKANHMLRKLESYSWIFVEVDHSYVQRVSFHDYAIQIIKTLQSVSEERRVEYQGYIYTIYNLARDAGNNPGLALLQIAENMDALITGLKSLNANIKRYIDDLTKHSTVAEIMDALLNDYYTNVVDKAYHRLLTSDNVAKFRPEILERLEADSRSEPFLKVAAAEVSELREMSIEEAREYVLELLHEVIDAFRSMDNILDEINKKNTRYQRAAINRARFLLSSSEDIKGQLKEILSFMNERIQEERIDYGAIYELEETDRLIKIFAWDYLDTDSLYTPIEGKKEFVPQDAPLVIPDEKERQKRRQEIRRKLEHTMTPARITAYVKEQLGEKDRMLASELPIAEGDTFIKMIYIRLYGQRKQMPYRLELMDRVAKDGFRFRDFAIVKRER